MSVSSIYTGVGNSGVYADIKYYNFAGDAVGALGVSAFSFASLLFSGFSSGFSNGFS